MRKRCWLGQRGQLFSHNNSRWSWLYWEGDPVLPGTNCLQTNGAFSYVQTDATTPNICTTLWRHSYAALLLPMAWSRCDMLINAATPERWNTHSIDLLNCCCCCCCCVRVNRTSKIRIRKRKTENRKENGKQERKQKIKISKVKTGESRKRPTGRQQKQNQQISKENRPQKTENSKRKTDKWNIEP